MSQKKLYGWNPCLVNVGFPTPVGFLPTYPSTAQTHLPIIGGTTQIRPYIYPNYFFYGLSRPNAYSVYDRPIIIRKRWIRYDDVKTKTGGLEKADKKDEKKAEKKEKTKSKSKKQTFVIHDNGGRPFEVTLSVGDKKTKTAVIARDVNSDDVDCTYIPNFQVTYTKAWVGFGSTSIQNMEGKDHGEWSRGNNILLENPDNFKLLVDEKKETKWPVSPAVGKKKKTMSVLLIGSAVQFIELPPGESIVKFVSNVGNNDVPYAYFFTQKYTYLVAENVIMKNSLIPPKILENPQYDEDGELQDVYRWYYKTYSADDNQKIVSHYDWFQVCPRKF